MSILFHLYFSEKPRPESGSLFFLSRKAATKVEKEAFEAPRWKCYTCAHLWSDAGRNEGDQRQSGGCERADNHPLKQIIGQRGVIMELSKSSLFTAQ